MPRNSTRVEIPGKLGTLSGILDAPDDNVKGFGVFSHCFSCTKDLKSIVKISRALADNGYAVLRFDFAGLGNSEGNFSDTTFLDNLNDVRSVVRYLSENHTPPRFLIGHSLGGSAMLALANEFDSVEAISVIASPSDTTHLADTLIRLNPDVEQVGEGMVNTGTYEYLIRKPTVHVLREYDLPAKISELAKRILVFHSAADVTLDIKHGKAIIELCRGPGSLIHLESANHLLTDNRNDCPFIAQTISSWLDRYLESTSK